MRLIDADELILVLNDYACIEAPKENEDSGERRISEMVYRVIQNCIGYVENHPTAYDVDDVVEKLGEIKVIGTYPYDVVKEAIEIVKGGGIDGR